MTQTPLFSPVFVQLIIDASPYGMIRVTYLHQDVHYSVLVLLASHKQLHVSPLDRLLCKHHFRFVASVPLD